MQRTQASNAVPDMFGPGKPGFGNGTDAQPEDANGWQEEIANVIEAEGITLDGGNLAQLLTALDQRYLRPSSLVVPRIVATVNSGAVPGISWESGSVAIDSVTTSGSQLRVTFASDVVASNADSATLLSRAQSAATSGDSFLTGDLFNATRLDIEAFDLSTGAQIDLSTVSVTLSFAVFGVPA
ncbi:MAG: hypothetical protein AAGF92_14680 [Myxococcota bacterium]